MPGACAPRSPFRAIEGWHLLLNLEDLLHNVYLGHGRDAVGSALVEVLECQGGADTWGNILARWDRDFREWLRGHGVRPPRHWLQLRALNLGADGKAWRANFPTVANCWKGAEVRLLIAFVARVTLAASGTGLRSQLVATCLWGLADFLHVLDIGDRHLSSEHAARAAYAGRAYLQCYHHLAALALEAGERRWKMRPKHHYFWHMVRASAWHPHADIHTHTQIDTYKHINPHTCT